MKLLQNQAILLSDFQAGVISNTDPYPSSDITTCVTLGRLFSLSEPQFLMGKKELTDIYQNVIVTNTTIHVKQLRYHLVNIMVGPE